MEVKREYYQNCFILATCFHFNGHHWKNGLYSPVGPWICRLLIVGVCVIYMYIFVFIVLPLTTGSFLSMFWRWCSKRKRAPPPLNCCGLLLQCETRGLFMSLCHPLLHRRCTRFPGCIRLRNHHYFVVNCDRLCVQHCLQWINGL